ncbi:MAG: hypothetical protein OXK80_05780 [Bdellovibrionales bacterium]|nr:hypothetical protein [Bdellovibrionales bacterium]
MKWFCFVLVCLSIFPKYVYSSDGCENVLSALVNSSENLVKNIKENLSSPYFTKRLQGLRSLKEINPDGMHTYLEIIPLLEDSHPLVRMETAKVLEQQDSIHVDTIYALHRQLQREKDSQVAQTIDSALTTIHRRHLEQVTVIGNKIRNHLRLLNFSIQRADHLVRKLRIGYMDWVEITQNARITEPETHEIMDELALEIYLEISAIEDDFRDMIRTLPFKNSSEFLKFFVHYQRWTDQNIEIHPQTLLIIKMIYSSI